MSNKPLECVVPSKRKLKHKVGVPQFDERMHMCSSIIFLAQQVINIFKVFQYIDNSLGCFCGTCENEYKFIALITIYL